MCCPGEPGYNFRDALDFIPMPLSGVAMPTRGDMLRCRIAFALIRARKIVRGLRQGLSEEERYAVADHVVAQLKEHGDPWRLAEDAPAQNRMPTTR